MLNKIETTISISCYVMMIIMILYGVFLRFVLRSPNYFGEELSQLLLFFSTLIGISMAVRSRNHLGVGMFVAAFPKPLQKVIKILVDLVSIIIYFLLISTSIKLFQSGLSSPMKTPSMQIPYYYIYFAMICGFVLVMLRSIVMFVNDHIIKGVLTEKGGGLIE